MRDVAGKCAKTLAKWANGCGLYIRVPSPAGMISSRALIRAIIRRKGRGAGPVRKCGGGASISIRSVRTEKPLFLMGDIEP